MKVNIYLIDTRNCMLWMLSVNSFSACFCWYVFVSEAFSIIYALVKRKTHLLFWTTGLTCTCSKGWAAIMDFSPECILHRLKSQLGYDWTVSVQTAKYN